MNHKTEITGRQGDTEALQLKKAGLRIASTGADFNLLAKDVGGVIKEAQTFGAEQVMCAWIPHEKRFSRADVDKAAAVFMKVGRAMRDAGLRFLYHVHGYEFQQGPDGTLFDALAKQTERGVVDFQMDVFWVVHGGASPVELFAQYPQRFPSTRPARSCPARSCRARWPPSTCRCSTRTRRSTGACTPSAGTARTR